MWGLTALCGQSGHWTQHHSLYCNRGPRCSLQGDRKSPGGDWRQWWGQKWPRALLAHGTLGTVVVLWASPPAVWKYWQVLLSLYGFRTHGKTDMAEEIEASPVSERRDQTKRHNLPGTRQDPLHEAEFAKTEKVAQEWQSLSQVGQKQTSRGSRGCSPQGRPVIARALPRPSLHLLGMGRNIATSVKLLNAALQRVMDPGDPKRRAVHKAPKLRQLTTCANAPNSPLIREEQTPGGSARATEPPVEPRTECHWRLPDKCPFLGIVYRKKMKAYFATNSFKQKWSLSE